MRISTNMIFQRGTNGILDQQAQLAKTQVQMSSGKKERMLAEERE